MTAMDEGLGALFIGMLVSSVLHGITLAQAWYYFSGQGRQFEDGRIMKALVALVVALDFVHQVCTSKWMYIFCVTNFGNAPALMILPPSYLGMAYPTGFVTILVQGFYVWRIWKLCKKPLLFIPIGIAICSCVQEAIQLYSMSLIGKNPNAAQFTGALTTIVIVVNGIGAGTDVLIAVAMVFLLGMKRSSIMRTNRILRSIAINSVTTGAITSICAVMVLVTAITLPATQYVLLFYLLLTRLYSNSLLATLNVRDSIRQMGSSAGAITGSQVHPQRMMHPAPTANEAYRLEDFKQPHDTVHVPHQSIAIKVDTDRRTEAY